MMRWFFVLLFAGFTALLFAAGPELSGVFDSTFNYTLGAGDAENHSFGLEEFANLRLRVRAGEKAVFYSAINLIAVTGNYLETAAMLGNSSPNSAFSSTPLIEGENYAAGFELERLYLRINGDLIDAEAGLLRLNFGYGQVWGSSDFLNPRNPLVVNARPRGVIGANISFYPADSLKLMAFAAAPKNPLESGGGGFVPGFSLDQHWDRASLQALYAYETGGFAQTPGSGSAGSVGTAGFNGTSTSSNSGIHRFGLSLKADMELGFVADALYTLVPGSADGIEGLSAGAGFDYSFLDGDLYVLFEYLFNGDSSVSALGFGGNWRNHHYLYGSALYRFNDYCSINLANVFCFDDLSFSPFATFTYELFQGFSLSLTARVPLDRNSISGGKQGELGPVPPGLDGSPGERGARLIINAGARLRF